VGRGAGFEQLDDAFGAWETARLPALLADGEFEPGADRIGVRRQVVAVER
jgi:hypothetical protein